MIADDERRPRLVQRLTLRLGARLAARLCAAAHADDRTVSEFVRELLQRSDGGGADAGRERTS